MEECTWDSDSSLIKSAPGLEKTEGGPDVSVHWLSGGWLVGCWVGGLNGWVGWVGWVGGWVGGLMGGWVVGWVGELVDWR